MYGYGNSMFLATHGILARTNAAVLPVNTVAPAITGTAQEGQTLTCSTGTWTGTPTITYTYQWKRNGSNIGSATNSTYTLVTADVGQSIKCTVTATNFSGSANADSNTVTPTSSVDADAQAFITAASITDPTQQSAINQLVVDLKGYNIWTKLRACYPFLGGTSSTHKWNLKDPRDLDAAFRLVFSGGVTHSSNGVQFGGINGYADTKLNDFGQLNNNNKHISMYQRNILASVSNSSMGADNIANRFFLNFSGQNYSTLGMNQSPFTVQTPQQGMFAMSKTASGSFKYFQNALSPVTKTGSNVSSLYNYFIGACSLNGNPFEYAAANIAFASIGDGLTDTEAANLYTAVQAFQTTLGRSIGTQTVSDADAQAFVNAANITDQVEANAINNLVIGLKADGLWTKMKAVYPMVGGTSTTTSYNLRNTAQYQITWNGGITFSSTGVLPNGTNGYGQTGFSFNSTTALSSHISTYIRTNSTTFACEIGSGNASTGDNECRIVRNGSAWSNNQCDNVGGRLSPSAVNSTGLILNSRRANNDWETYQNGISLATKTTTNSYTGGSNYSIALFARNSVGSYDIYSNKQCAFASIGDGLTDTDVTNLNTRVTTFQTALNRNV